MAPRYGDFTFDSSSGFTGSVKRKAFKHGGYAEGGMRSESTQAALARRKTRDATVDAISAEAADITAIAQRRPKSEKDAAQQAMKDASTRKEEAIAEDKLTQKQTGYSSKGDKYSRYLGYKKGGYAEGSMRSERTEVEKASREVQDNALAPAKQLNKSLKNLYNTRKQTGYDGSEGYAKGGPKKLTPGEDPRQMLLGDISPVTQKERLEAAAAKPMRGSSNQKSSDDLFRPLEPDMLDLMKRSKGGKVGYAGGGLHKMRSDKGVTGKIPGVKMGRSGSKMPGMLPPMNAGPKLNKPVDATTSSPLSRIAMKRGGKAKK